MVLSGWLRRTIGPSHRLICICSGALLAARYGLLDGRDCTTHQACLDELKRLAPRAIIHDNRLFAGDDHVMTSAGIMSGIDLMLSEVNRLMGPRVAVETARHMVIYLRRAGGDPQMPAWALGRNHLERAIHEVQDAIASAPESPWRLADLAQVASMSERSLSRHFVRATGHPLSGYINHLRVHKAEALLRETSLSVEAIAWECGFASARHFRRVFTRETGAPPLARRKPSDGS